MKAQRQPKVAGRRRCLRRPSDSAAYRREEPVRSPAGARVSVPSMKQASAWGAALLAGLSSGLYDGLAAIDQLIQSKDSVSIHPKPDSALNSRYSGWRARLKDY